MTQPDQTRLARKWKSQVNTNTVASPTWTDVKGVNEFNPNPFEPVMQEDNAYDQLGWQSSTKTAMKWGAVLKLLRRTLSSDDVTYDPGQEKLRALGRAMGPSAVAHFRYYDREGGPEAYEGFAEVQWSPEGGGQDDLESVTVTLTGKGELTEITNPVSDTLAVPTVTAVAPATGPAAGGTLVKITGTSFTSLSGGAAAVKFGATNATSYAVESSTVIYAVAPAKAAATYDVTVTNTAGTSATAGTANDYVYT